MSIFKAVKKGDINEVETYLAIGTNIDVKDELGYTILHHAASNGHHNLVKNLLEHHHPNINSKDLRGNTALMLAAISNKELVVLELLQHRADPNISNKFGNTPLHAAAENCNLNIVQLLVLNKADLNSVSVFNRSIMHSAALGIINNGENWELIKWLVKHNVSPWIKDEDGISVSDVFYERDHSYASHYEKLIGESIPIDSH